jgi:hypothetical protein
MDEWTADLRRQVREQLSEIRGDDARRLYDLAGIVDAILCRYGYVEGLDEVDADTLHAIYSAHEI